MRKTLRTPAVLMPAVEHIATKHCTLGIRAEQYAIVGRHLLASIKEVLGEAATDELVEAWAAAYQQLADILIGVESAIYAEQTTMEGGWSGWRPFKVLERKEESPDVVSFDLVPADGGAVPNYKPGQFISVRTYLKDRGIVQPRQYSLSRAPGAKNALRISVQARHECRGRRGRHELAPAQVPAGGRRDRPSRPRRACSSSRTRKRPSSCSRRASA